MFNFLVLISEKVDNSSHMFVSDSALITANIYSFEVNNRNTRKRRQICSKLIIKTPERCY